MEYLFHTLVKGVAQVASSNRERFVILAEKRVSRTLKDLRLVGNLANKSNYSYTDDDVKKILGALEGEIKNLRKRFESSGVNDSIIFKL